MKEKKSDYLLIKIVAAVIIGIIIGFIIKSTSGVSIDGSMSTQHVLMNIVLPIKHILGQVIFFMVPLTSSGAVMQATIVSETPMSLPQRVNGPMAPARTGRSVMSLQAS